MTPMSDLSRVLIETLSDKLYSTRRETDFLHRRMNWRIHAPRKTLIAHEIINMKYLKTFKQGQTPCEELNVHKTADFKTFQFVRIDF